MFNAARQAWARIRRAEIQFARRLRRIASHIEDIMGGFKGSNQGQEFDAFEADRLAGLLDRYGEVIEPWAELEAKRMVAEVAKRDEKAWMANSRRMAKLLRQELNTSPVGAAVKQRSTEAAQLITSLPGTAAERVRALTIKARADGTRPADLEAQIMALGDVTKSRAKMIARTEVARTASVLTQTRAESVGSTHYIWRTVKDAGVRPSHKKMEGIVCEWAKPPTLEDGTTCHAGQIYNCRCFPEPIFNDD